MPAKPPIEFRGTPAWPSPFEAGKTQGVGRRCALAVLGILAGLLAAGCSKTRSAPVEANPGAKSPVADVQRSRKMPAPPPPRVVATFTAIAEQAGITFRRHDDMGGLHRLLEVNGGGVALFDYDGDGRLDIFWTNGCELPLRTRTRKHISQLYRNLGNGRFAEVTNDSGMSVSGFFSGCTVGDYDGDGFDDLYVTAFGRNVLWHNQGDGTFHDVTSETGAGDNAWGSSVAMADVNRDGHLDIYVVNYLQAGDDPPKLCPQKNSPDGYVQCTPDLFAAASDVLFLSDGAGQFKNVTRAAGIVGKDGKGLGVVIFDMDRDGWPDVCVANDGVPNFLYVNRSIRKSPDTKSSIIPAFREDGAVLGVALNYQGDPEASMGIACGDSNGDGWLDLLMTHFYSETNSWYRNLGGRGFSDETNRTNLGPPSRDRLGFGAEFFDFDNDGWLDLFVANGHVDDIRWAKKKTPYRMRPQIFRNLGKGVFRDVSRWSGPYFGSRWLGRGAAVGDLDNDGDLDLAVSHQLDPSSVLRNDTVTTQRSVILKLVGRGGSNRSAVGARVVAEGLAVPVVREVLGGGGFQSCSDRRIQIGLGAKKSIPKLRIKWPSGETSEWTAVAAGHYVVVQRQGLYRLPTANHERPK